MKKLSILLNIFYFLGMIFLWVYHPGDNFWEKVSVIFLGILFLNLTLETIEMWLKTLKTASSFSGEIQRYFKLPKWVRIGYILYPILLFVPIWLYLAAWSGFIANFSGHFLWISLGAILFYFLLSRYVDMIKKVKSYFFEEKE